MMKQNSEGMYHHPTAFWVEHLGLEKHPEGGYYRETYRSEKTYEGRNLATSIYYLLPGNKVSRFHRLRFDEIWYFHKGAPLKVYFLRPKEGLVQYTLGLNPQLGQQLSLLVPGGTIFGGEVADKDAYALVSCHMAPGFDFEDFELLSSRQLLEQFPNYQTLIHKLT